MVVVVVEVVKKNSRVWRVSGSSEEQYSMKGQWWWWVMMMVVMVVMMMMTMTMIMKYMEEMEVMEKLVGVWSEGWCIHWGG